MSDDKKLTYESSGVSPATAAGILGEFVARQKSKPKHPSVLSGIGPFAACFSLRDVFQRFGPDAVAVSSCDGVGTKVKLALQWDRCSGLGEDLVAMNVNDLLCAGALPAFFLDYYACGKLSRDQLLPLLESVQKGCELARCALVGGETAEMPGMYSGKDFDLAGFSVGFADREKLLGAPRVRAGDAIVALASSGPHSNGYSLIRKILEKNPVDPNAKTPFSNATWAEALLKPTTIYISAVDKVLPELHALVHLTGGGVPENVPRVLPDNLTAELFRDRWEMPPLFQWLGERSGLGFEELTEVWNCGVGMLAICSQNVVDALVDNCTAAGVRTWSIGRVVERAAGGPVRWISGS